MKLSKYEYIILFVILLIIIVFLLNCIKNKRIEGYKNICSNDVTYFYMPVKMSNKLTYKTIQEVPKDIVVDFYGLNKDLSLKEIAKKITNHKINNTIKDMLKINTISSTIKVPYILYNEEHNVFITHLHIINEFKKKIGEDLWRQEFLRYSNNDTNMFTDNVFMDRFINYLYTKYSNKLKFDNRNDKVLISCRKNDYPGYIYIGKGYINSKMLELKINGNRLIDLYFRYEDDYDRERIRNDPTLSMDYYTNKYGNVNNSKLENLLNYIKDFENNI